MTPSPPATVTANGTALPAQQDVGLTKEAYPQLGGVATQDLVEQVVGANGFKAKYMNWSRTMELLRRHAPGWLPEASLPIYSNGGDPDDRTGVIAIVFTNAFTGQSTPTVYQALMDVRNKSLPRKSVTSRDITDTQVRGICKAAALMFGLAYELWAKMPLESGYGEAPTSGQEESGGRPSTKDGYSDDPVAGFIYWATPILEEKLKAAGFEGSQSEVKNSISYLLSKKLSIPKLKQKLELASSEQIKAMYHLADKGAE